MKYDDILVHIGEFGRYQKQIYFTMSLPAMLCGAQVMSVVFTMAIPHYRCSIPGYENDSYSVESPLQKELLNLTIPVGDDSDVGPWDGCHVYADMNATRVDEFLAGNLSQSVVDELMKQQNRTQRSCDKWVYDKSEFENTIMTEFDSYCDDVVFRSHGNMANSVGCMIGAVVMGVFSDCYGRKKAITLSIFLYFICTLGMALAPDVITLITIKGINGIPIQATFAIAITTGLELVGPNMRSFAGMMIEFYWTFGVMACLPIAYVIREWRYIQLVLSLLAVPLFSIWWLIPESPRWLLEKKRFYETEQVLEKICRSNKTELPPGAVDETTGEDDDQQVEEVKIWEIFKHRTLIFRTLLVFFNWLAVSLLYYGLSLNVGNLGGSTYINYMVSTLVEALGYAICFILLDRVGRRRLYCACMLLGGIACVVVIFPVEFGTKDDEWVITCLAMVGKMGSSAGYAIVYIMSAELFPTVLRNSALGACAIFENIGGIIAPYIADLALITGGSQELPLIIFGAVSCASGLLSLLLPETLGKKLPETIEDVVLFNSPNQGCDIEGSTILDHSYDPSVSLGKKKERMFKAEEYNRSLGLTESYSDKKMLLSQESGRQYGTASC